MSGGAKCQKWSFIWVCLLLLSLAYEKPLIELTSFDRINPRLFDIVVVVGVVTIWSSVRIQAVSKCEALKIWLMLVGWFVFCAVASCILLVPFSEGVFSLFYAARFVVGMIPMVIIGAMRFSPRQLRAFHGMVVVGGIFAALYCIPEYLSGGTKEVELAGGKIAIQSERALSGPFGVSYFHLAQFSSLAAIMTLGYAMGFKRVIFRVAGIVMALFVAWPLFFCGSRTGLSLAFVGLVVFVLAVRRMRVAAIIFVVTAFFGMLFVDSSSVVNELSQGKTIERFQSREQGDGNNSISKRVGQLVAFPFDDYVHKYAQPFIGGGFYVVPMDVGGGVARYRRGYGYHSIYWFAYEQAGLVGLGLFIWFIVSVLMALNRARKLRKLPPRVQGFVIAVFAYWIATLLIGVGAHNFWRGFASGNFNTLLLVLIILAVKMAAQYREPRKVANRNRARVGRRSRVTMTS